RLGPRGEPGQAGEGQVDLHGLAEGPLDVALDPAAKLVWTGVTEQRRKPEGICRHQDNLRPNLLAALADNAGCDPAVDHDPLYGNPAPNRRSGSKGARGDGLSHGAHAPTHNHPCAAGPRQPAHAVNEQVVAAAGPPWGPA